MNIFVPGLAILGSALILITLGFTFLMFIHHLKEQWELRNYSFYKNQLKVLVAERGKWLSSDFPIVDRVIDDLLKDIESGVFPDEYSYREKIRKEFFK